MTITRKSIHDADALLLYQVGPVYCCSPTLPVEAVIMPPRLTHPPGSTGSMPGVFKYSSGIVHVVDLRKRFGVADEDRVEPGRIVVVEVEGGHAGMWVDEIIDVISFPTQGWSPVPAYIPRTVFSKTLLYEKEIMLYADFENLNSFREAGYLRKHIETLNKEAKKQQTATNNVVEKPALQKPVKDMPAVNPEIVSTKVGSLSVGPGQQKGTGIFKSEAAGLTRKPVSDAVSVSSIDKEKIKVSETKGAEPLPGKISIYQEIKPESDKSKKSNKTIRPSTASPKTTKSYKPQDKRSTDSGAVFGHDKNNFAYTREKSNDNSSFSRNNNAMVQSDESNIIIWGFAIVLVAMLVVLYYSAGDLFPDNNKNQVDVVLSSQEKTPVIVDKAAPLIEIKGGDLPGANEPDNISGGIQDDVAVQQPDPYRADIVQDKDDIVIILQQLENDSDVFMDDAIEIETGAAEALDQSAENAFQETHDNEINSANATEYLAGTIHEDNKDSVIIVDQEKLENTVVKNVSIDSEVDKEIISKNNTDNVPVISKQKKAQQKIVKKQVVHVVVKGDTLWHIARRYIKDPFRYPELAKLSKIKNPDLIYPGNKVIIIVENKKP